MAVKVTALALAAEALTAFAIGAAFAHIAVLEEQLLPNDWASQALAYLVTEVGQLLVYPYVLAAVDNDAVHHESLYH